METQEVNLSEVLSVAAMTIRLEGKEQTSIDPELLRKELEDESWYQLGNTSLH